MKLACSLCLLSPVLSELALTPAFRGGAWRDDVSEREGLATFATEFEMPAFFLTTAELKASRGGHPRSPTGIADSSSHNEVLPLINGQNVMLSLLADIRRAVAGDSIHMTGYAVNGDMMLDPPHADTKLTTVLIAASLRNVTLRFLVNDNLYLHSGLSFCHKLNPACRGETCCAPETRHNGHFGSLHAKSWNFIFAKTEVVAYVGSMDMDGDRWDTSSHNDSAARESEPYGPGNHFHGWHGDLFRLRGVVAQDVVRHFWLQWNDPAPMAEPYTHIYKLKPYKWKVPPLVHSLGNVTAQLLRTLSCQGAVESGQYQTFAPHGEYSFTMGFKKLMESARQYIYIEDQFMFYDEAMQIVADALPHVEAVIIMTDNASAFTVSPVSGIDITIATQMRFFHQRKALDILMANKTLAAKVHIFELAREGFTLTRDTAQTWLYTHAKNYLVDDKFMIVGSHGIERTAWTNDVEISIGVTDGTSGPDSIVGRHRRKLLGEYLRLLDDDPKLFNPMIAIAELDRQADQGNVSRVRHYYPSKVADGYLERNAYLVYEPEGRCNMSMNSTEVQASELIV